MAASLTTCWFAEVKQENYIEPVSWIQVALYKSGLLHNN